MGKFSESSKENKNIIPVFSIRQTPPHYSHKSLGWLRENFGKILTSGKQTSAGLLTALTWIWPDIALLPLQEIQEYQNRQRPLWTEAHSQELCTTPILFQYKRTSWHCDITVDGTFRKRSVWLKDIHPHSNRWLAGCKPSSSCELIS